MNRTRPGSAGLRLPPMNRLLAVGEYAAAALSFSNDSTSTGPGTHPIALRSAMKRVTSRAIASLLVASLCGVFAAQAWARDTTPPVITSTVTGNQGNNGWYIGNATLTWTVTDPESTGIRTRGCGSVTQTTDTAGKTYTCSARSRGGTSQQSVTIKRDATPPTVTITQPASGATYNLNQSVTANFACSDATAGIATCTGTASNGSAIDTASTGTKSFTVTAIDKAGNMKTATATYTVNNPNPPAGGGTRLFAWNDLGMHCMDTDYSVFTLLPPFNDLNAQLMVNGTLVGGDAYTLTYESASDPAGSVNTYSVGPIEKTNFWDYFDALFGLGQLPPNIGMTGNPTASAKPAPLAWDSGLNWYEGTGIPITPIDDAGKVNPFPVIKVTAKDSSGNVLATAHSVLPVATEINCALCHASVTGTLAAKPAGGWVNGVSTPTERDWRLNVLRLHDERNAGDANYSTLLSAKGYGTSLEASVTKADPSQNKPIFCDTCHNSNALAYWGLAGEKSVSTMTAAMHTAHATVVDPVSGKALDSIGTRDACYNCHPGKITQCLRGAMGNPVDGTGKHLMECQSCHGSMATVGGNRNGWYDVPTCQSCHHDGARDTVAINPDGSFKASSDIRFATNADTPAAGLSLYRFSVGHGSLQCEACHNSTHAEFTDKPSANNNSTNDDLRAIEAQGYVAAIRECTSCHATAPKSTNGGPHGMHYLGQSWVSNHEDVVNSANRADCFYCHGSTSAGSDLAVIKVAKTFKIDDGRTKTFVPDQRVTCWSCHNGPNP
jgi:hypothetical protein